jgi:hypothetical protein
MPSGATLYDMLTAAAVFRATCMCSSNRMCHHQGIPASRAGNTVTHPPLVGEVKPRASRKRPQIARKGYGIASLPTATAAPQRGLFALDATKHGRRDGPGTSPTAPAASTNRTATPEMPKTTPHRQPPRRLPALRASNRSVAATPRKTSATRRRRGRRRPAADRTPGTRRTTSEGTRAAVEAVAEPVPFIPPAEPARAKPVADSCRDGIASGLIATEIPIVPPTE